MCQVTDSVEYPVSFISKTLSKVEKRWSVYEKEAFAIFYALRKWEYYLRDIKFVLFTDHKNLTYLNNDPSPKVQRWKIAVQQYDFDIAYIEGEKNTVADGFSRFCPKDLTEEAEEEEAEEDDDDGQEGDQKEGQGASDGDEGDDGDAEMEGADAEMEDDDM